MENKYENIDESIARILSNEASPADHSLVEEWIALSDENRRTFESSKRVFEESAALKKFLDVDSDKAWMKVKRRMIQDNQPAVIPMRPPSQWNYAWRIAAMILITAGLGTAIYFILNKKNTVDDVYIVSSGKVKQESLPDGSTFTLNKNSSISFSSGDYGHKRMVHLKGEAFFDVKHDETKEFIVEAGGLQIKDIGRHYGHRVRILSIHLVFYS